MANGRLQLTPTGFVVSRPGRGASTVRGGEQPRGGSASFGFGTEQGKAFRAAQGLLDLPLTSSERGRAAEKRVLESFKESAKETERQADKAKAVLLEDTKFIGTQLAAATKAAGGGILAQKDPTVLALRKALVNKLTQLAPESAPEAELTPESAGLQVADLGLGEQAVAPAFQPPGILDPRVQQQSFIPTTEGPEGTQIPQAPPVPGSVDEQGNRPVAARNRITGRQVIIIKKQGNKVDVKDVATQTVRRNLDIREFVIDERFNRPQDQPLTPQEELIGVGG